MTQNATNCRNFRRSDRSQLSTVAELLRKNLRMIGNDWLDIIIFIIRIPMTAAWSSNFEMVNSFIGTTFVFAKTRLQHTTPLQEVGRTTGNHEHM